MPSLDNADDLAKFEKFFSAGREAFSKGKSLKEIFMTVYQIDTKTGDTESLGYVLGFADALVEKIRKP